MRLLLASAFLVLHTPVILIRATEPPTTPLLRIETGMHTAPIKRVASDAAGRLALTCGHDKTARLWSLPDLKSQISNPKAELLRTFRIPIGSGDEGKLYTCALSSDGAIAALAGVTGYEWDYTQSIYLFDTTSGYLLRRLDRLPRSILRLAFSPSGQTLAALLGIRGLRLFDSRSGQLLAQDSDYESDTYCVDWQGESRLVTTCLDGRLRLYQGLDLSGHSSAQPRRLKPDHSRSLPQGKWPVSAHFSPDGRQIAVGFDDSTQIALVSAADLSSLPSPFTGGIANGSLSSVAWSADGLYLAAGGRCQDFSRTLHIRLWSMADGQATGKLQDLPLAKSTIMDLQMLPGGGFLWGAADPAWGITTVDSSTKAASHRLGSPPIVDFRKHRNIFHISADACVLAFDFQLFGKQPAKFHLLERRLTLIPSSTMLRVPRTEGLPVTDWENTTAPKLASRPLKLKEYERSRSLAISADSRFFLLGTEWYLRCYAKDGNEQWKIPAPGIVSALNMSIDGNLAVAAYGDGTIRWHRTSDGRELLAFFPHADQKRWVLWTPEGYFDCSTGGEELIGWHVNRRKDQAANFFPSSRFHSVFYRPDVIQRVLKTRDVFEAVKLANREIGKPVSKQEDIQEVIARLSPPIVELECGGVFRTIHVPANGGTARVRYSVRQSGRSPATRIEIRYNGRPVSVVAPVPAEGSIAEVDVPLPDGMEGPLSVIASHDLASSEAAVVKIKRTGLSSSLRRPELYLVTVGASELEANRGLDANGNGNIDDAELASRFPSRDGYLSDLPGAAADARLLTDLHLKAERSAFGETHLPPQLLVGPAATRAAVLDAIDAVAKQSQHGDVLVVSLACHGISRPEGYQMILHDYDFRRAQETALNDKDLLDALSRVKASVLLLLGSCQSGAVFGRAAKTAPISSPKDLNGFINTLGSAEHGVAVISAAESGQYAYETDEGSFFMHAVVEGLSGKAALEDKKVTCRSLQDYVQDRVPEMLAKETDGMGNRVVQTPASITPRDVPDFALAKP